MLRKALRSVMERTWLRIGTAVALLVIGMAPVGAPIFSDNAVRESLGVATAPAPAPTYDYRFSNQSDGTAVVQRSPAGASDWTNVASIPEAVQQMASVAGKGQKLVYARTDSNIWRSEDAGATWAKTAELPSRPSALAAGKGSDGLLLAGTAESGLFASYDHGATWRAAGNEVTVAGPGTMAVSAVTFNPNDDQIVYVAADFTMATPEGSHIAHEALLSVDGADHWFALQPAANAISSNGANAGTGQLLPVADRPLAVTVADGAASQTFALPSTDVVLQGLESSDPGMRAASAKALGLSRDPAAVTALIGHLRDSDQAVGDAAAAALGKLGDLSAVGDLRMALTDHDESVRGRSAYALGLLKDEASVPQLASMLLSDGPLARTRAADGLAAMGSPAAIAALTAPLADSDMTAGRQAAMQAIEGLGRPAVPQLLASLESSNPALRRNAAEMLGWVPTDAAVPALSRTLSDADPAVRTQAAWALGEIGTVPAQQALAKAIPAAGDQATRQAATQALAQAQRASKERESISQTPLAAAMHAVSQIPASRWTLLALVIMLAGALLVSSPRQPAKRTA